MHEPADGLEQEYPYGVPEKGVIAEANKFPFFNSHQRGRKKNEADLGCCG
jgi:hypothetical protein